MKTQIHLIFLATISVSLLPEYAAAQDFLADFNAEIPAEFSGGGMVEGVQGYSGIGFDGEFLRNPEFPATSTILTLTNLPAHSCVDISFLLAIIDSWDGEGSGSGPDRFNVVVDNVLIFSEVFENSQSGTQPYEPAPEVELARRVQLGFNPGNTFHRDSAYHMGLDPAFEGIPHTSETLTIEWFASGPLWQGENDESWAIDNVSITLNGNIIPGDVNLDGILNLLDVAPFVDRISTGTFQAEADTNQDSVVNLLDVDPFILLLSGG